MSRPDTVHELKPMQTGHWSRGKVPVIYEDLSMNLPLEASLVGMSLTFEQPEEKPDPVYLKDRQGNILHEWRYTPSLAEVWDIARKHLGLSV
jgi:hypothetical protein